MKRSGPKSAAQTPAPPSERRTGSKVNPKGSAASAEAAKDIEFSEGLTAAIANKVKAHNSLNKGKKLTLPVAKAVVRRGMGAYSKSFRPTISKGLPNSRQAWGLARLDAFIEKAKDIRRGKASYIQDNDLLKKLK